MGALIEAARERGVEVAGAHHSYTATQSNLRSYTVPGWAVDGGDTAMVRRFDHPDTLQIIDAQTREMLAIRGGGERILFADQRPDLNGRTLREVADEWGMDAPSAARQILREGNASVMNLGLYDIENIRDLAQRDWMMTCTDGRDPGPARPVTHPRAFGSFTKKIRDLVLDERLIALPFAVRSMTGLAADFLGWFRPACNIREGVRADIAVLELLDCRPGHGHLRERIPTSTREGTVHVLRSTGCSPCVTGKRRWRWQDARYFAAARHTMAGSEVLASRDGALLTLTLNRPHRLNAVNVGLYEGLVRGLERADQDGEIRCVILTGTGRAFCAGADLKEHRDTEMTPEERRHYTEVAQRANHLIQTIGTPVVAAVNGHAIGAGLELACRRTSPSWPRTPNCASPRSPSAPSWAAALSTRSRTAWACPKPARSSSWATSSRAPTLPTWESQTAPCPQVTCPRGHALAPPPPPRRRLSAGPLTLLPLNPPGMSSGTSRVPRALPYARARRSEQRGALRFCNLPTE